MNKFRWVWELLPAHFKVVSFSFNFPDNLKPSSFSIKGLSLYFHRLSLYFHPGHFMQPR
jgi:hypothetical protein